MKKLCFLALLLLILLTLFSCKEEAVTDPEKDYIPTCDAVEVEKIEDATKNSDIATAEALVLALDRGDLDWRANLRSGAGTI